MSDAYNIENQNNAALSSLSQKISALRGVTVDIYDQARNHDMIDANNDAFGGMQQNIKASMGRLTRMAQSGNKVAVLKLSGMLIGAVIVLYYLLGFIFGGSSPAPVENGTGH